eukprot:1834980-Rhodomonas_salina.1
MLQVCYLAARLGRRRGGRPGSRCRWATIVAAEAAVVIMAAVLTRMAAAPDPAAVHPRRLVEVQAGSLEEMMLIQVATPGGGQWCC